MAKPITMWNNRDQAFATIAEGISNVIQQTQREEKYPIHEYGLAFDYYTFMDVQTQEELAALERAKSLQWTLANDLDLADIRAQIYEQTGKLPLSSPGLSTHAPESLVYLVYEERKNSGVKAAFSSQTPGSMAKVRFTHDTVLDGPFYRAHERFSVRIILSILRGEIPYRQVVQLIEEACTPFPTAARSQ